MIAAARNPLSVILLLVRGRERRIDFRVGRLILSARRTDLVAVSEVAIQGEYVFLNKLAFPGAETLVLDIGANIGCFAASIFSICPDAEVHSVEPSPDTFAVLVDNRRRYPHLRWHPHQTATASVNGTLAFQNDGPSTARRLTAGPTGLLIGVETFDSFVSRVAGGRRIFVCKMDIEGAEVPIFGGTLNTLAQIDHFIVEVHGSPDQADIVTARLSAVFPHLEEIQGRRSSKPLIHAWRVSPTSGRVQPEDTRAEGVVAAAR